jgi:glycosyltransferase involved in cell wall biosynthesis
VIPAFNEEATVGEVVERVRAAGLAPIVVDDGSVDRTGERARDAGAAAILRHPANRGKGAALATGFAEALRAGHDAAIVIDADLQHVPAEAARFVACREATGADLVVGTRMRRRRGMPFVRWATNAMMSNLLSMLAGVRLTDTQCGMKLLSRRALERVLSNPRALPRGAAARFDIESEIVLTCAAAGFAIQEVPISTIYVAGRRSHIRPVWDTVRFLWLVARHLLKS